MTVRLRPHHLLCLLTYVGEGYSPGFVAEADRIAARLSGGEDVLVVEGPDDLCAPLFGAEEPHCVRESVVTRDRLASESVQALLGRSVVAGARIELNTQSLTQLRLAFASGQARVACVACEWSAVCDVVAARNFLGTKLG